MIKTLQQAVFLRLTLFFVSGILIQIQINLFPYWIYGVAFSLLILLLAFFPKITASYRWRWLSGFGLFLLCVSVAGILTYTARKQTDWNEETGIQTYRVHVIDDPVRKPKTWMCKVKAGDKTVLVYLPVDSISSTLLPSDWIDIKAHFEKTDQMYLWKEGIAARAFVYKGNWKKSENPPEQSFNLHFYSLKCRRIVIDRFKEILPDEKSFAVAAAITFGYVDELDKDVRQTFAATGTAHILSISGLHFAILYGALNFLFSFMGNNRRGRFAKQLIILPLLWIYAFFTGMPPAVTRSVIMITFWGIGNAFSFRGLTINTLGATAFLMLLYNPFILYDIGFQLSFTAVLAILLINPYLSALYHSRNPMINYVWEMSCTSISAQFGTAPISLYYFHRFPLLFLIGNIFAVPLSGILMLLAPLSLFISFVLGNRFGLMIPLQKSMQLFINGLNLLAEVPHGVVSDIQLTAKDALNLALGLIFSFLLVIKRRLIYLCLLLILVILQVLYYLCTK